MPAIHAISIHNLSETINFRIHPCAYLLTLFDEIQDWGRPTADTNRDIFTLSNIEINTEQVPTIKITLNISDKRKSDLNNTLKKRLQITDKLKIVIMNENQNEVYRNYR